MIPLRHINDDELTRIANEFAIDLSFYYAGWDYPETARRERPMEKHTERLFVPIRREMNHRGLQLTVDSLARL